MVENNGSRQNAPEREDNIEDDDFDPKEYDEMMRLERLESLEEDMVDLGVTTLSEVRQRIHELHQQLGDEK